MEIMREAGKASAIALRAEAKGLSGTEIIARERDAPDFDPEKDYSAWPIGAPVRDGGQVWTLLQPYDAAKNPGRPEELRAIWGLCHTKDPEKAKPWVDPFGTSGLYFLGECYRAGDGTVFRCKVPQTNFNAEAYPDAWEKANE